MVAEGLAETVERLVFQQVCNILALHPHLEQANRLIKAFLVVISLQGFTHDLGEKTGDIGITVSHLVADVVEVFDGADIGELMSMEGAVLKGVDIKTGKTRSIVAYYKYYRKV